MVEVFFLALILLTLLSGLCYLAFRRFQTAKKRVQERMDRLQEHMDRLQEHMDRIQHHLVLEHSLRLADRAMKNGLISAEGYDRSFQIIHEMVMDNLQMKNKERVGGL